MNLLHHLYELAPDSLSKHLEENQICEVICQYCVDIFTKDDVAFNQLKLKSLVLLSAVLNFLRIIFQHGDLLDQWIFRYLEFLKSTVQLLSKKGSKGELTLACTEINAVSSLTLV